MPALSARQNRAAQRRQDHDHDRLRALVRETRETQGLSIERAAAMAGVSPTTWGRYESGHTTPHGTTLESFRRALQLPRHIWEDRYQDQQELEAQEHARIEARVAEQTVVLLSPWSPRTWDEERELLTQVFAGRARVVDSYGELMHEPLPGEDEVRELLGRMTAKDRRRAVEVLKAMADG
ncbi:helix-turn-helix domain-containing protein [Euzebya sp.]|uniref:helix-turn-helix domain-containing protein n=1 Tax=Euzebya sp. TaxID=1971409 RepID=UPI0035137E7F